MSAIPCLQYRKAKEAELKGMRPTDWNQIRHWTGVLSTIHAIVSTLTLYWFVFLAEEKQKMMAAEVSTTKLQSNEISQSEPCDTASVAITNGTEGGVGDAAMADQAPVLASNAEEVKLETTCTVVQSNCIRLHVIK